MNITRHHNKYVIHNHNKCYACKACQIICSYHHNGSFWPEKSSIWVSRNPQDGEIFWNIDSTCDGCKNETKPLCVKFCIYGAMKSNPAHRKNQEAKIND